MAENAYQLNGLNITNFRNGLGASFVPFEFVQELQIKTGGYEAEYGRATGGVVNMVTKSGTNAFHGDASVYFGPESLQEQEPDIYAAYNQRETTEESEYNASVGGPIIRDNLFFFAFVRYWDRNRLDLLTTTGTRFETAQPYYGGKVDWNITNNHRLEGTYISDQVDTDVQEYDYDYDTDTLTPGFTGTPGARWRQLHRQVHRHLRRELPDVGSVRLATTSTAPTARQGDHCPYAGDRRDGQAIKLGCWVNWSRGVGRRQPRSRPDRRRLVPGQPQPARRHRRRSTTSPMTDAELLRRAVLVLLRRRRPDPRVPLRGSAAPLRGCRQLRRQLAGDLRPGQLGDRLEHDPERRPPLRGVREQERRSARPSSRSTTSGRPGSAWCGTSAARAGPSCTPAAACTTCRSRPTPTSGWPAASSSTRRGSSGPES